MTDFIDDTTEIEDRILQQRIEAARRSALPPVTGRCFNCDEPIDAGRFCPGGECQEDWERRQRLCGR
jgi:hypothetical protein